MKIALMLLALLPMTVLAQGHLMTRWGKKLDPAKVHTEYPRPQMVRGGATILNGWWEFEAAGTDKKKILVPFAVESALSGIGKTLTPGTPMTYRRSIGGPVKGKRTLLHFEASDYTTTVFVNGAEVGSHTGGYNSFSFDITDHLKAGDNELKVVVVDPTEKFQVGGKQIRNPRGIWYTPTSGIWQTVWTETVPETYVTGIRTASDFGRSAQLITVNANQAGQKATIRVLEAGKVVATQDATTGQTVAIKLQEPKLWGPGHPFLYDLEVTVGRDKVKSYFGYRHVEIKPDKQGIPRILLNGQEVFCAGPLDQGYWPDGILTAPSDAAQKWDLVETLKYGFNTIRKHVKVEPKTWYAHCDRMGILVWQDMPSPIVDQQPDVTEISPRLKAEYLMQLERIIDQLYSVPSIIMWVPFNEGWGQHDTESVVAKVRGWDKTRLINNASGWTDKKVGDTMDIHHYPNPSAPPVEKQRVAVLGEFGGLGLPVTGHTWVTQNWGYITMSDTKALEERFIDYWREVHALKEDKGLTAAIYTQTTDVETETNGLMTYDREVHKLNAKRVRAAVEGKLKPIRFADVIPTGQTWHFTTSQPADDWFSAAPAWTTGKGAFGTEQTPGIDIGTTWNTPDIWMHTTVDLRKEDMKGLMLKLFHDEDSEIYFNGVLAMKRRSYVTSYVVIELTAEAKKALKPGKNLISVHCHQTNGGQGIDLGFVKRL